MIHTGIIPSCWRIISPRRLHYVFGTSTLQNIFSLRVAKSDISDGKNPILARARKIVGETCARFEKRL